MTNELPKVSLPFDLNQRYSLSEAQQLLQPMTQDPDKFVHMFANQALRFINTVKNQMPDVVVYWMVEDNHIYPQIEDQ